MAQMINTNIASLNAQRNLTTSQNSLATSLQRLSSGLRINSAKDDSAGLAISERFTTQIRGNEQAARNANDGISLAQTAEGDLEQIGNNLQRIRELAVQSSNATNSASDRASINNEARQLIDEIDRVAGNSSFNGHKLLDGTFTAQSFQVGANNTSNDRITVASIASAKSSALGLASGSGYSTTVPGGEVGGTALAAGALSINGVQVGAATTDGVSSVTPSASGIAVAAAINAISTQTGVTATVGATTVTGGTTASAVLPLPGYNKAIAAGDVSINGVDIGAVDAAGSALERGGQVAFAINAKTSQTGVTASFDGTTGAVTLAAADGRNIDVVGTDATALTGLAVGTTRSAVSLSSTGSEGITVTSTTAAANTASGLSNAVSPATASGAGSFVSSIDLSTDTGAQAALETLDSAISTINTTRGALGAYQNRFESTVTSLQTTTENLSAARSRIRDADFAKETANLTRAQILQQAGTAMLAQANQVPQNVLSLLR